MPANLLAPYHESASEVSAFDWYERRLIEEALAASPTQAKAAVALGVSARVLNYKMGVLKMRPVDQEGK